MSDPLPARGTAKAGAPIEFWFDFASGYAYFAALEIEEMGGRLGRPIVWRPFMLGTAFKATGVRGLSSTPLKRDYAWRDWDRIARLRGVPFRLPGHHPSVALPATRLFYVLDADDPARAKTFARAVFDAYFTRGIDSGNLDHVLEVAGLLGFDTGDLAARAVAPEIKEKVRTLSEAAVARGMFGSPFFIADGEPFWGWDRMAMMEQWVARGGW
ncbi:MAG: 2-hydroxychromene-2-carboxylate isomerase [Rhizobiales bacterium 17-65-6]|nr:MAG: 2-hydroxychromene-2-carboxylate isomerase [Rhizobiales bacterium 12-68-15]OYX89837.1 MAG: 2-hydroxychromene-2-carboxylate isomerase [Azorhizobium sp. 32-67-21]OYY13660.1 MAG: 2-hydroxychromene-2-carboxylate isomerase [Rhizobiales bacterium 35-68-8]OZA00716.1 MAG: 2-hydroxychromene-2-carboxylate isomerase [Rhizobiales bacterium 17-65-6]